MRKLLILSLVLVLVGCTSVEKQAYNTVVAAKAFLDNMRTQHPECSTGSTSILCVDVRKAVAAKDVLIDSLETYCSGPQFETGGPCNAPAKGTPALSQATSKLQAAIANYNQSSNDVKSLVQ